MRRPLAAGFTLVELLVSVAVIAVLLGLLAPALKGARDEARNSACLSNQRQLAVTWIVYGNDHGRFPSRYRELEYEEVYEGQGLSLTTIPSMWWDWGGVDWNDGEDAFQLSSSRPLNAYVGDQARETSRAEIFQCPSDDFLRYLHPDNPFTQQYAPPIHQNYVESSNSPYAGETLFDTLGNSYRANDWIWTKIGSRDGWDPAGSQATTRNRPDQVDDPWRFPLIGDYGTFLYTRYPESHLETQITLQVGFWHGKHRHNLGFFDGSARSVPFGYNPVSPDYSFYLSTHAHAPRSVPYAHPIIPNHVTLHGYEHMVEDEEGDGGN